MGSVLSFVIKSLVLRPREIKSTKHPWGSPSSGGDCASLALFSLIPSFPSQHLVFSWLLQFHHCPSCLCLAPRPGKAKENCCPVHRRYYKVYSFFHYNLKKKNSASHSIINASEHWFSMSGREFCTLIVVFCNWILCCYISVAPGEYAIAEGEKR